MADSLISVTKLKDSTQIELGATLDVASASGLKLELGKVFRRKPPFDLDGSLVDRIDTAGLQVLLAFMTEARNRELELKWTGVSDALMSASRMSGLAEKLELNG